MEQRISTGEIEDTLRLFVKADAITELRVVDGPYGRPVSGYFDPGHLANAAQEAAKLTERCTAVYFVPNPVKPELLARAANRIQERPKQTTSDHDIRERCWLYIDLDPKRAAGISSTDTERDAAFALTDEVERYLRREGWPSPVLADSGNGFHLVYRIELPNDEPSRLLVEGVLKALDFLFSNEQVVVDTANGNAARIWKLYGTLARKGDPTADRPHRLSSITLAPEGLEPVPPALLARLAGLVPKPPTRTPSKDWRAFDVPTWVRTHVDVAFEGPWQAGYRWILRQCPWNSEHTNRSAFILQFPSGAPAAGCRHNGCKGKKWDDLRILLDPEYAAKVEARKVRQLYGEEPSPNGSTAPKKRALTKLGTEFKRKAVKWLWPGYLQLGKIVDLQGDPGRGKSMMVANLAATITIGGTFPDGTPCEQGGVLIFSTEDDGDDTIIPRLEAAHADLSKVGVHVITLDDDGAPIDGSDLVTLPEDLPALEQEIRDKNARLLVFDPLDAYLSDEIDANKNSNVRRLLALLTKMAARTSCTILLIRHLNKDAKTTNAMYRGGGSIGLNAASRSVLQVGSPPDAPKVRVLAPVKINNADLGASLSYHIEQVNLPADGEREEVDVGVIVWDGVVAYKADDLLAQPDTRKKRDDGGNKVNQVMEILEAIFADGAPHPQDEVLAEIAKHGKYSTGTIASAKKLTGIWSKKRSQFSGVWDWHPASPMAPDEDSIDVEFAEDSNDSEPSDEPPF